MCKSLAKLCILQLWTVAALSGQQQDHLKQRIQESDPDTNKVNLINRLAQTYFFNNPDSCLILCLQAAELAHRIHYSVGEYIALNRGGKRFVSWAIFQEL